ncbi:MAG: helix-turn-helix domain-containing protein [Eubacteriales bacterium]|nr:helix-turn-helix domain-containing protein [Eubacteriales bacterium]
MDDRVRLIAERLRALREDLDFSPEKIAIATDISEAEYRAIESGDVDIGFSFLYKAANVLNVDMTELLTGEPARLQGYAIVRQGEGLPIDRRRGFSYQNLAFRFKDRNVEPFLVMAPFETGADADRIALNTHQGQEMDLILAGSLRIKIGDHIETLNEGDTIIYDSSVPHGMVAIDGMPCQFLAILTR